jgi:E3 ubiquitin-protein ligase listerin
LWFLGTLCSRFQDLFSEAWRAISTSAKGSSQIGDAPNSILSIIKTLSIISPPESPLFISTDALVKDIVESSLNRVIDSVNDYQVVTDFNAFKSNATPLLSVFNIFGESITKEPAFINVSFNNHVYYPPSDILYLQRLHILLRDNALVFMRSLPAIELAYLRIQDDPDKISDIWHTLLKSISGNSEVADNILTPILDAVSAGQLTSEFCSSEDGELDALIKTWVSGSIDINEYHLLPLTKRILQHSR